MAADPSTFEIDGRRVRDLNGNGQLDPYEIRGYRSKSGSTTSSRR